MKSLIRKFYTDMKTINKFMRAFLIIIGMCISATVWAGVVNFNAEDDPGATALSVTKSGVTITVGAGTLNNESDYRWNAGTSNAITFSCSTKMTKIVISGITAGDPTLPTLKAGYSGTLTGNKSKWTLTWQYASGLTEVKFLNAASNQLRFTDVEVTLESTTCDLKVWNGSSYITWQTIDQTDPVPVGPPIAGYSPMKQGKEDFVWCEDQITTDPCLTYINNTTGTHAGKYRFSVPNPSESKHYPSGATTLYALYVKDGESCQQTTAPYSDNFWTVTFKANGGTGSDYTQKVVKSTATALLANRFTNGCNDFAGWATSSGGSVVYSDEGSITATSNTTLWAKWTPDGFVIETAVSPAASGTATVGGDTEYLGECGETGIALVATPAAGYYFKNWTKSPNNSTGGTIANANTASTTYSVGTADATLTANFLAYLTLTYDANGGSGAPAAKTDCQSGVSFSLSSTEPTRSNYVFLGWNTSSSATTAQKEAGDSYSITSNTTLYAVWCPVITGASLTVSGTTPTFNYSTGKGSTTFSWGSVTNATAYNLVIRNTTDGTDVYSNSVSASSSYTFSNMVVGKTYRATVTASNACTSTSGYADKSIACPAIAWPGESDDIDVGTPGKNAATITFTIPNAVSFEVWLTDGTAGGSEVVGSRTTVSANSSGVASHTFTGLTNDHTYYVHAIGKNICNNTTADKNTSFATAHQETYDTYVFSCVDFTATVPSGKAFVTSGNGKTILSKNPIHLVIEGAIANHYVEVAPSTAEISVYYIDGSSKYQVVDNTHPLRIGADGSFAKDLYMAFTPSAAGNGSVTAPTLTVRCDGFEQTLNSDGSLLKVRAMPEDFAIIGKVGNVWCILPADMGNANGTQPAVAVRVDDNDNPTTAFTEAADNAFRIWPIDVPGANRFKSTGAGENGAIIRLSMPNNLYSSNALAFGASSSSTAIGAFNNATITASNAAAGSHFYWNATTTENVIGGNTYFKYELYNPERGSAKQLVVSSKKWGTYGGTQEIRFVKIEETKDAELTIMEWGANQVVFRYPGSGTIALNEVSINNSAIAATMERIGSSDLYILSGLSTLQANPSKTLQIGITETVAAVDTDKESIFTIPFIIADGETRNNTYLRDLMDGANADAKNAIAQTVDIVVRQGGQFETTNAQSRFRDLYIYPGGKASLGHNIAHLENIYLRGGYSWLGDPFALPQMKATDDITITGIGSTGNGVFYDLYLDNTIYYMMALPKDVALNAVTNEEGGDDWTAWVKGYSGKPRSLNPSNRGWTAVAGPNLERGKGYEIAIKPRLGRPYGTLRFPLQTSSAWSNEAECTPAVVAWGMTDGELNNGVTANNAGWNLIGNPFFTAYNNTVGEESIIIADSLAQALDDAGNWTGKYKWIGTRVKFFTIPAYTSEDYKDVRSTPYKLDAFYPFFVQVGSGTEASPASLTFGTANRALKIPVRYSLQAQPREIMIDFMLSDENDNSDVAGLDISDDYSGAFDSDDKEKTILGGENYMKVYTIVGDYRVAFNALPEVKAAKPIPVGVITPNAGYYTFSLVEDLDVSEVEHVWLTDYEKSTQTDLLTEDYTFYGTHGQLEDRFAINVILKSKENTEDIEEIVVDTTEERPLKFIYRDQMYILYKGVIFDITGRKVSEINK